MLLVKLVLTGVFICTASELVLICPFHLFVDRCARMEGLFGHDFVVCPAHSSTFFPNLSGQTMIKDHVVAAYRGVIAAARIPTKTTDALGRVHELVAGRACRVVGAVWLYSTVRELYLVQVFCTVEISSNPTLRPGLSVEYAG